MIRGLLRTGIVAACAAAAATSVQRLASDLGERRRAEEFARRYSIELRAPELYHQALYETSADLAFADLARQALADATAPVSLAGLSPRERSAWMAVKERGDEELEEARRLCLDGLRRRPSWGDHAFAIGATTYLQWQRRGDSRVDSERPRWSQPLAAAAALEPAADDVASFRAQAELQTRGELSASSREILRRAFLNPAAFDELFPRDVAASGSFSAARADIPPLLPQQRSALRFLAQAGDVDGYLSQAAACGSLARERAGTLLAEMDAAMLDDRPDRAGEAAEELFATIGLSEARPEVFVRALECWPASHVEEWGRTTRFAVVDYLWSRQEQKVTRAASRRTMETMAHVAPPALSRLRLLAGDTTEADGAGRPETASVDFDAWQLALARARALLRQGRSGPARAALDGLPEGLRGAFETQCLYASIAEREKKPYALPVHEEYPASSWRASAGGPLAHGSSALLAVESVAGQREARVGLHAAAPAAVEIACDGIVVRRARVSGDAKLTVPLAGPGGRHELVLTAAVGGAVTPGPVSLPEMPPRQTTTRAASPVSPGSPGSRN